MIGRARIAAAAVAIGALAACSKTTAPPTGALLNEPSALAIFRGVTIKSGYDPTSAVYPYRPYLAIANAGSNDLSIADATDDTLILAPAPLRGLVYPLPGRPLLLAAAELGDGGPDLLVAVTAGDLPGTGGSQLHVIRTWAADGAVIDPPVELGGDILALAPLPFDPTHPGTVQIAAALAGERVAVVTFTRPFDGVTPVDPARAAIDPAAATVTVSAPLGFQPIDLAVLPGDRTRIFAATTDLLPGGVHGVAEVTLTGTPAFGRALDALGPTRAVGAAELFEADLLTSIGSPFATALDATAFTQALSQPPVTRVYAVLDESGCGLQAPIACGLVALDVDGSGTLLPDPTSVVTMQAPYRAPIQIGAIQAFATSPPPVVPPDAADPQYAGTYLRIAVTPGWRQTTAAAGVASADGHLTFVDLGRWDIPSEQAVRANVKATVTPVRPPDTPGAQWLVLQGAGGGTVFHLDKAGLTAAVGVTAGYTPTARWVVEREGILPNLQSRRAEAGLSAGDARPWLALQATSGTLPSGNPAVYEVVRLWDPTLGVRAGDTVVIDPTGLGSCTEFEATVADEGVQPPDTTRPGGWVHLVHRVFAAGTPPVAAATVARWDACVDALGTIGSQSGPPYFAATFRASEYDLLYQVGTSSIHVGRPQVGVPFDATWQDEGALALACPLPPATTWDAQWGPSDHPPPACGGTCRAGCELLQRVRLARRIFYLPEAPADQTGPAVAFTLALEQPTATLPRGLQLILDTADGRAQFYAVTSSGSPVDARAVVPFDRSPWSQGSGVRFVVPFAGGVVLDGTPTLPLPATSNTFQ